MSHKLLLEVNVQSSMPALCKDQICFTNDIIIEQIIRIKQSNRHSGNRKVDKCLVAINSVIL